MGTATPNFNIPRDIAGYGRLTYLPTERDHAAESNNELLALIATAGTGGGILPFSKKDLLL